MILIACPSCNHALRVTGDPEEISYLLGEKSELWPDQYACFNCGKSAGHYLIAETTAAAMAMMHIVDLTPQEALAALSGFGLPGERTCCREVILPYFEQAGIKVKGQQPRGQQLFRVEELTFPDGTTMFLAPSAMGAVIFRIKKPHSYAAEVDAVHGT
jgi:DNA-directed RNA polymerase subunit N (RpoN/RPB10)